MKSTIGESKYVLHNKGFPFRALITYNAFMMKKITIGIIADVDAGKTTLSEAMLYVSGELRRFGRVDKGESFLDHEDLERKRGITIFSKQARFSYGDTQFVLIDTPGHTDFSAETERTLAVLDYALLVISAPEGISAQTKLLHQLLKEYEVPVFVFFNKMDLLCKNLGIRADQDEGKAGLNGAKEELMRAFDERTKEISADLSVLAKADEGGSDAAGAVPGNKAAQTAGNAPGSEAARDFKSSPGGTDVSAGIENELAAFYERLAVCSENALEEYLAGGSVSKETIKKLIRQRSLTPCLFGSASAREGVKELLAALDEFTLPAPMQKEFSARVYKIARDKDGTRLTFVKISGGGIKVRDVIKEGDADVRITQIRFYSGEKYKTADAASAGDICALCGLKSSRAGEVLGRNARSHPVRLTPVLSYRLRTDRDAAEILPVMRMIEEESPELSVTWEEERREIFVHVMGTVQLEILTSILKERFDLSAEFDSGEVLYLETLAAPVIGAGHFEPLRHYAEVHLYMEPLPRGSGLAFESRVSPDVLAKNWQRLILTHLAEKRHKGVLIGAPVSDMKITLIAGRAHQKHTEGGDFRQATYRAVRQGLMMGECLLLEPFYRFSLEVPTENAGRALSDLDRMNAKFTMPDTGREEGMSVIDGSGPVAALKDYPAVLASYTKNRGRIAFAPDGYGECHNADEVIRAKGYDPLADLRNTPDSVFCEGGSGTIVPYYDVYDRLDLQYEDGEVRLRDAMEPVSVRGGSADEILLSQKEIDSIIAAYASANKGKKKGQKKSYRKVEFGGAAAGRRAAGAGEAAAGSEAVRAGERAAQPQAGFASNAAPDKKAVSAKRASKTPGFFTFENADILLVDGYNVIFAWQELNRLAQDGIEAARGALIDHLSKYRAMTGSEVIAVFDAYRVKGKAREESRLQDVNIVFTREDETADQYIEKYASSAGKNCRIAVVTSDAAEQQSAFGSGSRILSSREFKVRYEELIREMNETYQIK